MLKDLKCDHISTRCVKNIASDLNASMDQVNVKATRGEKLGFVGREEGIASECVVLLFKKTN